MSASYRSLFPMEPDGTTISLLLLAFRLLFGGLLFPHGMQKWTNFEDMSTALPNPLGVGHSISLGLTIFGELFCSIDFILGALYRLATIPMIFTMGMVFFVIRGDDPSSLEELAFVYLVIFILMYIAEPDKFSLDHLIAVLLL